MPRRNFIWPMTALGLAAAAAIAGGPQGPGGHGPPPAPHVHAPHAEEGRDPLLRFTERRPDSNAARQRRGEGPINRKPLAPNDFHNTGHPDEIGHFAAPTVTPHYRGYYVGGGVAGHGGEPRCVHDGTWGWDYQGAFFPRKVALLWSHGRKYQEGNGQYKNTYPYEYRNPLFYVESPGLFIGGRGEGEGGGEAGHRHPAHAR